MKLKLGKYTGYINHIRISRVQINLWTPALYIIGTKVIIIRFARLAGLEDIYDERQLFGIDIVYSGYIKRY